MNPKLFLLILPLLGMSCATSAIQQDFDANVHDLDIHDLELELDTSLEDAGWASRGKVQGKNFWIKRGSGGHRTTMVLELESRPPNSAFSLEGKSGHAVNWMSLGILGLAMKNKAIAAVEEWQASWRELYPTVAPY
jgi:hypothetical protein